MHSRNDQDQNVADLRDVVAGIFLLQNVPISN